MANKTYACFLLNNQAFGLDIQVVREINRQLNLTPVPLAPGHMRGLVNLRGQIVSILDLKMLLGLGETQLAPESHNIVLKTDAELKASFNGENGAAEALGIQDKMGLLVDSIGDILTVPENSVVTPPANITEMYGDYIHGVVKLHPEIIAIINIAKVVHA